MGGSQIPFGVPWGVCFVTDFFLFLSDPKTKTEKQNKKNKREPRPNRRESKRDLDTFNDNFRASKTSS